MNTNFIYSVIIYAVTFTVSTFFMWLSEHKTRSRKFFALMAITVPSVVAAYRESGVDYLTYKEIYYYIHGGGKGYTEWGWNLLNKISPTHWVLLFVSAFIFLLVIYKAIKFFIKENKTLAWFIVLIVPYSSFYNGMRQMLASAFVFLALAYFMKKQYITCAVLTLIGGSFHKTAYVIIFVLIFYLLWVWKKKKFGFIILLISVACFLMAPLAVAVAGKLGIFSKYFVNDTANIAWGFMLYMIPPLFFYYIKRSHFTDHTTNMCLAVYLLSIPFQVLGFRITYADRFMWFTQIFIVVLVPMIVSEYKKMGWDKPVKCMYYMWFVFCHIVLDIIMNGSAIYPYRVF